MSLTPGSILALLDCELESMSLDQLYIQYRSLQTKLIEQLASTSNKRLFSPWSSLVY
jgi:hypothetical protein